MYDRYLYIKGENNKYITEDPWRDEKQQSNSEKMGRI